MDVDPSFILYKFGIFPPLNVINRKAYKVPLVKAFTAVDSFCPSSGERHNMPEEPKHSLTILPLISIQDHEANRWKSPKRMYRRY